MELTSQKNLNLTLNWEREHDQSRHGQHLIAFTDTSGTVDVEYSRWLCCHHVRTNWTNRIEQINDGEMAPAMSKRLSALLELVLLLLSDERACVSVCECVGVSVCRCVCTVLWVRHSYDKPPKIFLKFDCAIQQFPCWGEIKETQWPWKTSAFISFHLSTKYQLSQIDVNCCLTWSPQSDQSVRLY